jgi:Low-density lipoprotein receptor domain class A
MERDIFLFSMLSTAFFVIFLLNLTQSSNFFCQNGESIGANKICDGISDCVDSSDERKELCFSTICETNQFKCHYGGCVHRDKFCNKIKDCVDGSDETNCGKLNGSCK